MTDRHKNITPMVSVIMPAYNSEEYIKEAIESILNQTFTDFEFIILDDCSKDSTWDIINKYAKTDQRIIAIKNETNLYIAKNRNKGLTFAKGKYIVWQDSDDISEPNRIEELFHYMEKHPEVGICGSYIQSFKNNKMMDIRKYPTDDITLRKNIFKFSPVAQPAAIIRKKCFEEIGDFDINMPPAEDIDLSFRIGTKYKFGNLPKVLLFYREHDNSATYTRMKKIITSTLIARKKYSKNYGYKIDLIDNMAYTFTWVAQMLPPRIIVFLFKIFKKTLLLNYKKGNS